MPIPPSLSPDFDLAHAKDVLARLERYADSVRPAPTGAPLPVLPPDIGPAGPPPKHPVAATASATGAPTAAPPSAPPDDLLPASVPWPYPRRADTPPAAPTEPEPPATTGARRLRINPATADLFPYDLAASIVACALTIMVSIAFGRLVALGFAVALAVLGEWMRRTKWFPSVGIKILIGVAVGLVLALTA